MENHNLIKTLIDSQYRTQDILNSMEFLKSKFILRQDLTLKPSLQQIQGRFIVTSKSWMNLKQQKLQVRTLLDSHRPNGNRKTTLKKISNEEQQYADIENGQEIKYEIATSLWKKGEQLKFNDEVYLELIAIKKTCFAVKHTQSLQRSSFYLKSSQLIKQKMIEKRPIEKNKEKDILEQINQDSQQRISKQV